MSKCVLYSTNSGRFQWREVVKMSSIRAQEFFKKLSDYWLLKKDSAPRN